LEQPLAFLLDSWSEGHTVGGEWARLHVNFAILRLILTTALQFGRLILAIDACLFLVMLTLLNRERKKNYAGSEHSPLARELLESLR